MIVVTNKTWDTLKDRYDGVDYEFPAGKSVGIPVDVARHVFGYGVADKTATLARLGWMRTQAEQKEAMDKLGGFVFSTDLSLLEEQQPALLIGEESGEVVVADDAIPEPDNSQPESRPARAWNRLTGGMARKTQPQVDGNLV